MAEMNKVWLWAILSLLAAVLCWGVGFASAPSDFETVLTYTATCCSILFVCLVCVGVGKRIRKDASAHRIFAAADIVIGAATLLYAVYDMIATADSAYFPGLGGWFVLLFVIPCVLLLLLIDFIAYRKSKKINS